MDKHEHRHFIRQFADGRLSQTMTRPVIASTEVRRGSDAATLVERTRGLVRAGHPDAYCIPCLAGVLMAPEKLVRDAALLAVLHDGLRVERRMCHQCGHADDALSGSQGTIQ